MSKMMNVFNNLISYFGLNIAGKICATSWIHDHNSNFPDTNRQNKDKNKESKNIGACDKFQEWNDYNGDCGKKANQQSLYNSNINIISEHRYVIVIVDY